MMLMLRGRVEREEGGGVVSGGGVHKSGPVTKLAGRPHRSRTLPKFWQRRWSLLDSLTIVASYFLFYFSEHKGVLCVGDFVRWYVERG